MALRVYQRWTAGQAYGQAYTSACGPEPRRRPRDRDRQVEIKGRSAVSIELTKPLVVPEYETGLVKLYVRHPVTLATVPVPSHTHDFHKVLSDLFPGEG